MLSYRQEDLATLFAIIRVLTLEGLGKSLIESCLRLCGSTQISQVLQPLYEFLD